MSITLLSSKMSWIALQSIGKYSHFFTSRVNLLAFFYLNALRNTILLCIFVLGMALWYIFWSFLGLYGWPWGCCNGTISSSWMSCPSSIAPFWRWCDSRWRTGLFQFRGRNIAPNIPPRSCSWRRWIRARAGTMDTPRRSASATSTSAPTTWARFRGRCSTASSRSPAPSSTSKPAPTSSSTTAGTHISLTATSTASHTWVVLCGFLPPHLYKPTQGSAIRW